MFETFITGIDRPNWFDCSNRFGPHQLFSPLFRFQGARASARQLLSVQIALGLELLCRSEPQGVRGRAKHYTSDVPESREIFRKLK